MEMKSMQFGYAIEMMFQQVLPNLAHGNDGLIFTCRTSEYKHGTDPHILKWKPENENSIDFKLRLDFKQLQPDEQDRAEGITEPYYDYDSQPTCNLFVFEGDGREDSWYSELILAEGEWEKLKSEGHPLQDRIVECYKDDKKQWRYMRFRDDKENANHSSTVASVIGSIEDRVTKKDLADAAPIIRTEWKRREAKRREIERATPPGPQSVGIKRKADEHGGARPSPGPPAERKL
jgi:mRNA guanylyltransferase